MITAAEIVAFIATASPAQLDALERAIKACRTQLADAQLWRELRGDNRTNPNRDAIPASPTEWSRQRFLNWELEQQQRIAEREANTGTQ
jgi:hypothetical protein